MKNLIIDGNNLIHRTFWTAKTNAGDDDEKLDAFHIYFTLNAIRSYVEKYKPTKTYICWDLRLGDKQNAREDMFGDYKGNRTGDKTPHRNNDQIREFLNSLGIASIYPFNLEADDCVAMLCDSLPGAKVIISVDRDFLQLIDNSTIVYDPIRKVEISEQNFEQVAKCKKEDFLTLKCLMGDKSDNVPGIKGFGLVTAKKYIRGEIKLTSEQRDTFARNHGLFRLNKWSDKENTAEQDCLMEQLDNTNMIIPDYKKFLELCEQFEMNNILAKKEDWYRLFFVKSKLQALFG